MDLRRENIERLKHDELDVLVIGGGINGAVSAAALAARGLSVGLIDARDFAGFTSQQSSNLVWGGIKYMEGYEFGLVADLCKSRNELLDSFPSTVREIRFLLTINRQFRFHPLVILASTWLYWLFGRGKTRMPRLLSLKQIRKLEPLVNTYISTAGIEYSDAFLHDNDARFVFNFVRSAMDRGCIAANYVTAEGASRDVDGTWLIDAEDQVSGDRFVIRSKVLINAAGAYVDQLNERSGIQTQHHHLLSKGIHLLVPRISQSRRVLAFPKKSGASSGIQTSTVPLIASALVNEFLLCIVLTFLGAPSCRGQWRSAPRWSNYTRLVETNPGWGAIYSIQDLRVE